MNHPVISSYNAATRFSDFIKDAENHRQRKRLQGNGSSPLGFLTSVTNALTGVLPKIQSGANSNKMPVVKS